MTSQIRRCGPFAAIYALFLELLFLKEQLLLHANGGLELMLIHYKKTLDPSRIPKFQRTILRWMQMQAVSVMMPSNNKWFCTCCLLMGWQRVALFSPARADTYRAFRGTYGHLSFIPLSLMYYISHGARPSSCSRSLAQVSQVRCRGFSQIDNAAGGQRQDCKAAPRCHRFLWGRDTAGDISAVTIFQQDCSEDAQLKIWDCQSDVAFLVGPTAALCWTCLPFSVKFRVRRENAGHAAQPTLIICSS